MYYKYKMKYFFGLISLNSYNNFKETSIKNKLNKKDNINIDRVTFSYKICNIKS